jgi:NAD-dependent dihydropyrimidine dehydrogenase PreA subunit
MARMEVQKDHCKGCGLCINMCPVKVIFEVTDEINKLGYHPARYKGEGCTGCKLCYYTCPEPGAIIVFTDK